MRKKIFPVDWIIFIVSAALICGSFFYAARFKKNSPVLVIQATTQDSSGKPVKYIYPLDKNNEYIIKGIIGNSVIKVENGKAWFKSSPCPNHSCTAFGKISSGAEWAACLPNGIIITVEGSDSGDDLDIMAE